MSDTTSKLRPTRAVEVKFQIMKQPLNDYLFNTFEI